MHATTLANIFGSILGRLRREAVIIRTDMVFLIRYERGHPRFALGPTGSELACYIPAGMHWKQLNFGQSEGQADIDGREWGFYWQKPDEMAVVLHSGEATVEVAAAFVWAVAEKVAGATNEFQIVVAGGTSVSKC